MMGPKPKPVTERFWSKVSGGGFTECWEWTGYVAPGGYGRINVNGTPKVAHRVAYELMVGPIPEGLDLDHLCRNRACVNPYHLDPVTRQVNLRRSPRVQVTHCPAGHPYAGDNLLLDNGKRKCRTCVNRRVRERKQRITNTTKENTHVTH